MKHQEVREAFLDVICRGDVGFVVMDEVHIHVQNGMSFCDDSLQSAA